jgi:hypothetical protein
MRALFLGGALAILSVCNTGGVLAAEPAKSTEVRLSHVRSNTATLQSVGRRYAAVVTVRPVRAHDFLADRMGGHVRTQIDDLVITMDGKPVRRPLSVIADADDPVSLRLVATKRGVVIEIAGSDGGEAYRLEVVVDGARVVERRILAGDHVLEDTRYHEVVID